MASKIPKVWLFDKLFVSCAVNMEFVKACRDRHVAKMHGSICRLPEYIFRLKLNQFLDQPNDTDTH